MKDSKIDRQSSDFNWYAFRETHLPKPQAGNPLRDEFDRFVQKQRDGLPHCSRGGVIFQAVRVDLGRGMQAGRDMTRGVTDLLVGPAYGNDDTFYAGTKAASFCRDGGLLKFAPSTIRFLNDLGEAALCRLFGEDYVHDIAFGTKAPAALRYQTGAFCDWGLRAGVAALWATATGVNITLRLAASALQLTVGGVVAVGGAIMGLGHGLYLAAFHNSTLVGPDDPAEAAATAVG